MRRLFSTFATGLPGIGLLIMRFVASGALMFRSVEEVSSAIAMGPAALLVFQTALGMLLLAGLWTPVAGTLVAMLEVTRLFTHAGDPWIHILLATLGASLSLLGPGAWSIDARLFGWRRINIDIRSRQPR